jgi:hypothetical protein
VELKDGCPAILDEGKPDFKLSLFLRPNNTRPGAHLNAIGSMRQCRRGGILRGDGGGGIRRGVAALRGRGSFIVWHDADAAAGSGNQRDPCALPGPPAGDGRGPAVDGRGAPPGTGINKSTSASHTTCGLRLLRAVMTL